MKTEYIIGLIVLGIIAVGWYMLDASSAVVSAQGTSSLKVQPDNAAVYVLIEMRNKTAQEAQSSLALVRDSTLAELGRIGIAEKDIQLLNYAIYQDYDWSNGKQTPKGFVASQQIIVNTKEFDNVADIVDAVVQSGALVSTIQFELSQDKQNEYKASALTDAGADAKIKAEATAAGLGKKIGRLISVQSQEFNYPGPLYAYEKAMDSSVGAANAEAQRVSSSLSPSDIEVSATLTVQYKLSKF